jgi:hypothetical protein
MIIGFVSMMNPAITVGVNRLTQEEVINELDGVRC